ncbi:MAG TPA: hypothetical protein VMT59_03725 [Gaiellaceae bacterium]|nr:hypothetical protein [Gaiellaceae bacterium]
MRSPFFAVAALSAAALVPVAQGTAARPLTTAPNVFDDINVTISDTHLSVSRLRGNRGDVGRFVIRNTGTKAHTFVLGVFAHGTGQNAQGLGKSHYGVQTGFATTVKPKQQKTFLLFFDFRGPVPFKADGGKTGKGTFTIH